MVTMVKNGIDNIDRMKAIIKEKRVGLITNQSGINKDFEYTIDIFEEHFDLRALYSPEHGIRGNLQAGEKFSDYVDDRTKVMVYSLYGENRKPSKDMLKDIDILVFDIGDVGSRYYTYIYTMAYCMKACREHNKTFIVLDRINILGGIKIEGNLLDPKYKSFVGLFPIPIRYGLTIGELAYLINEEFNIGCNLEVIKLDGWNRKMYQDDTDLLWVNPSPNIPRLETALLYNGICLFEGTNISEGRGTTNPFEIVGAPWIDGYELANRMEEKNILGIKFRPIYFTPTFSKYQNEICQGIQIHVLDKNKLNGVEIGLHLLNEIIKMGKGYFKYIKPFKKEMYHFIDYLSGTSDLRKCLGKDYLIDELMKKWREESQEFKAIKEKYHIYSM